MSTPTSTSVFPLPCKHVPTATWVFFFYIYSSSVFSVLQKHHALSCLRAFAQAVPSPQALLLQLFTWLSSFHSSNHLLGLAFPDHCILGGSPTWPLHCIIFTCFPVYCLLLTLLSWGQRTHCFAHLYSSTLDSTRHWPRAQEGPMRSQAYCPTLNGGLFRDMQMVGASSGLCWALAEH